MWRIEVKKTDNTEADNLRKNILDLGIKVDKCEIIQVYIIETKSNIKKKNIENIARQLFTDEICETYKIIKIDENTRSPIHKSELQTNKKLKTKPYNEIEIAYKPGVMDPVTESALKGIEDIGIKKVDDVKTRKKFLIYGKLKNQKIDIIANKLLFNQTIQEKIQSNEHNIQKQKTKTQKEFKYPAYVNIISLSINELVQMSKKLMLGLNAQELKKIQNYFKKIGRNPTDIEIETIAQTWSEHCIHKTFKSKIKFDGKIIPPLFSMIKKVTKELSKDWCVSVFEDNAGIIKFTDNYNVCFKVETHNHPSAIEPYGGAGTGIGGVIRDILGTGLGAKPILNTNVFAFGLPDYTQKKMPEGMLHPLRVMKGVVAGIRDYGNKMGIPTANGAVFFDEQYTGNPLVYCGTVGIIPKNKCTKKTVARDLIVLLGGRTGRDGIHGVNFASGELSAKSETIASTAVQIGNPITEKKVADVLLKARDLEIYRAITDCGGGGLSSAVGELAKDNGAVVELEKVPLKYEGLSYKEIWISEAQERMIVFVPKNKIHKLYKLCKDENVEATVIGRVTNDKMLTLKFKGTKVGNLKMNFLHEGIPLPTKIAISTNMSVTCKLKTKNYSAPKNLTPYLLKILSDPNIRSKEWIIRQYDHEVQGGSCVKPLVGFNGPADACVVQPILGIKKGIVVGCGINPMLGKIDPYRMGASAVDEAIRNVVAVGCNPQKIALLDNFSWGNPDKPKILGELVKTVQGCCDMAKIYQTPFISGKDSLNNEYNIGKKTISIPGTLLISAIGIIEDVNKAVTSNLKSTGNSIYIIGKTRAELGAGYYYKTLKSNLNETIWHRVPEVTPNPLLFRKIHHAMQKNLIESCHDCSEGGIAVTCAEMCIGGNIGMQIELNKVPSEKGLRDDYILFSESNTRFIVEVVKENEQKFENIMSECDFYKIGTTTLTPELTIFGKNKKPTISVNINDLRKKWNDNISSSQKKYSNIKAPGLDANIGTPVSPLISFNVSNIKTHKKRVLILRTAGTNCDMETKFAFELVGAKVDLLHINQIVSTRKTLNNYDILAIPGGFTYGDDISAGKILANEIKFKLKNQVENFIDRGKLIIGICNGFQVLLKLGLLPSGKINEQIATLTNNVSGKFQCEWVELEAPESPCIFTKGLINLRLPIAHGEGRFIAPKYVIEKMKKNKLIALYYKEYNPNGSIANIAGICDKNGRIFGLMPHPERFIFKTHSPNWSKNENAVPLGLLIFKNAVNY